MKCGLCSFEFDEKSAESHCGGCSSGADACCMVRCPRCSYTVPREPPWIKRLRSMVKGNA